MNTLRQQFPLIVNSDIAYLDNAATTQKPQVVIDAINNFYQTQNANPHSALHSLSSEATNLFESCRLAAKKFLNAGGDSTILINSGTTAGINFVAHSWGVENLGEDDEIILSVAEHHANLLPWIQLANKVGAQLKYVGLATDGTIDVEQLKQLITAKTKLIAVTLMSNVTGVFNNHREISELARTNNVALVYDAAQAVAHTRLDLQEIDCDFLAFSGHKIFGPTGIGFLYAKTDILENIAPPFSGGSMVNKVMPSDFSLAPIPQRFEPGTMNLAGAAGMKTAFEFIENIDLTTSVMEYAVSELKKIPEIQFFGEIKPVNGIISFNVKDIHAHDLTHFLDQEGVMIRSGHHCAQLLLRAFDTTSVCRASFTVYNNDSDVDRLVCAIRKAIKFFA